MNTDVYSWRVSTDLKADLEREARRRNLSVSAVLDLAAREWLNNSRADLQSEEEQLRLQQAAAKCFGSFASGKPQRAENARETVRRRLRDRHDG